MTEQPPTVQAIRNSWRNGGRWLLIAAGIAGVGWLTATVAGIMMLLSWLPEGNPLRYEVPQQVIGGKEIIYRPGDPVTTVVVKCNEANHPVRIEGRSYWVPVEHAGTAAIFKGEGTRVLDPKSCLSRILTDNIPPQAFAGKWRIEGEDCVPNTTHCRSWFTETFEVVAGE